MTHAEGRHRLTEPAARPKHVLALLGALGVLIGGAVAYAPGAQAEGAASPPSVAGDALPVPVEVSPAPVEVPPVPVEVPPLDAPSEVAEAPGEEGAADDESPDVAEPTDDSVTVKAAEGKSTISLGAGGLPVTALDAPQRSCGAIRAVVGKDGWLFALPAGDARFTAVRLTLTNDAGDTVTAQTGAGSVLPGGKRAFVRSSPRGLALTSAEADIKGTATSFALVGACPAPRPVAPPAPPPVPPSAEPAPTAQPNAPTLPNAPVSPAAPTPSATEDPVKNVVATQPATTPPATTSSAPDAPDSSDTLEERKVAQAAQHAKSLSWNLAAYAAALLLLVVFALVAWFVVRSRTSE
jgi:hypothetical protein